MKLSRRALLGGGVALLLLTAAGGGAAVRVRPHRVQIPADGRLTRAQVRQWARAAGVSEAHIIGAIMLGSERPGRRHAREQAVIAATAINRTAYPAFGRDVWSVLVGDAPTTGPQGGTRHYATSRPQVAAGDLPYYVAQMDAAIRRGRPQLGGVTHFHHLRGARAAEVTARWQAAGYRVVPLGVPATVFAPSAAKAAAMRGAA